ncbi:MAG: hypothetical protein M1819_005537 [Sarea resinae]|nr:MAG: hypothetical protein M1819_005537 [Sarea resinae]
MFAYLRSHHKRGASTSNPASPSLPSPHLQESPLQSTDSFSQPPPPRVYDSDSVHSSSPISPLPPILPPIPRVASRYASSQRQHQQPDAVAREKTAWGGHALDERGERQRRGSETEYQQAAKAPSSLSPVITVDEVPDKEEKTDTMARQGFMKELVKPNTRSSAGSSLDNQPAPFILSSSSSSFYSTGQSSSNMLPPPPPTKRSQTSPNAPHLRTGKTKLNLLNPMSLLMRRRSSQAMGYSSSESGSTRSLAIPGMKMPDDFDPSIRGKGVHDFSAPRPRRNFSYSDAPGTPPASSSFNPSHGRRRGPDFAQDKYVDTPDSATSSPRFAEKEHMAAFREHFGEEVEEPEARRDTATNTPRELVGPAIPVASVPLPEREAPPVPSVARPFSTTLELVPSQEELTNLTAKPHPVALEESATENVSELENSAQQNSRSRASSVIDPSFQPSGLPKHLTSNASRFSFDLAGVGSAAQEKLLEEKHKSKAATDKDPEPLPRESDDFDEDDMFEYGDIDDGAGFEEEIPGVNVDPDADVKQRTGGVGFNFALSAVATPISMTSPVEITIRTPRNSGGQAIGLALAGEPPVQISKDKEEVVAADEGLVSTVNPEAVGSTHSVDLSRGIPGGEDVPVNAAPRDDEDDDLYFDDGLIDLPHDDNGEAFDESIFDDENGPFHERRVRNIEPQASSITADPLAETNGEKENVLPEVGPSFDDSPNFSRGGNLGYRGSLAKPQAAGGLTQAKLEAYHDALAAAANQAAADGKFVRRDSVDTDGVHGSDIDDVNLEGSQPGLIPDEGRFSQETTSTQPEFGFGTEDDFDYGALEDDPMIAEANAEALANDAEGIYGQEFGFYAQADGGTGEAEYFNGGYFGPRALDGLIRSQSGHMMALREPNLTPITERSEYSNRNSLISSSIHSIHATGPQSAHPLNSPGLAQLAGMMSPSFEEDELSLGALMKLRKGAWGGSNGSASPAQSPTGGATSPLSYFPPLGGGVGMSHAVGAMSSQTPCAPLSGSTYSLASSTDDVRFGSEDEEGEDDEEEEDEGAGSAPGSPTITIDNHYSAATATMPSAMAAFPVPAPFHLHQQVPNWDISPPNHASHNTTTFTTNTTTPESSAVSSSVSPTHTFSFSLPTSSQNSSQRSAGGPLSSPASATVAAKITNVQSRTQHTHSRDSSSGGGGGGGGGYGADSITYLKEEDEMGGDRWVLERRRTAESGEVEVVGREVVEGGRI